MVRALHQCSKCYKTFSSDKALHGHMRVHSDNPPRNSTKSCKAAPKKCSTSGEGSDSYASKSLKTSLPNNSPGQYKQILSFRAELEAFYKDWDTNKYYEGDGSQYEARYIRTLNFEEYDPRFKRFCKRLISKGLEEEEDEQEKEEEGVIKTTSTPTIGGHQTSKRAFDSHQALGGHQKSYRQKTPALLPSNAKGAVRAKVYICKTCKQKFSSGQALGGHQRLHYEGPLNRNSAVKGEVEKGRLGSSPASTHGSLGLAANGDKHEYEEGEIPPSPDNSTALELEMQVEVKDEGSKGRNMQVEEVKDEGSKGHNLESLRLKLEMQVEVDDEVTAASTSTRYITIEEKVVEEGEEKGAMVTNQIHVDPRSNHCATR